MPKKVTCTLPNAGEEISGVKFAAIDGAVVAEGLSDEDAALFDGIPGYTVEDEDGDNKPITAAQKKAAAAKAAAEEAEAAAAKAKANEEAKAKGAAETSEKTETNAKPESDAAASAANTPMEKSKGK